MMISGGALSAPSDAPDAGAAGEAPLGAAEGGSGVTSAALSTGTVGLVSSGTADPDPDRCTTPTAISTSTARPTRADGDGAGTVRRRVRCGEG